LISSNVAKALRERPVANCGNVPMGGRSLIFTVILEFLELLL
jgi:hypothetical protein